jgi:hypothetical protein
VHCFPFCNSHHAAREEDVVRHIELKQVLLLTQLLCIGHMLEDRVVSLNLPMVESVQQLVCSLDLRSNPSSRRSWRNQGSVHR